MTAAGIADDAALASIVAPIHERAADRAGAVERAAGVDTLERHRLGGSGAAESLHRGLDLLGLRGHLLEHLRADPEPCAGAALENREVAGLEAPGGELAVTVTCGALKEAAKYYGDDLGVSVTGGKGATSRRTPAEIESIADRLAISTGDELIRASKLSAKVDSAALQDGYELYQAIRRMHPSMPVLMMTAFHYDRDHIIKRSRMEGLTGVIFKKPVDPQRLREVILETVDRKKAR